MNKSKHGGNDSGNRIGLFLAVAVLFVCTVAFVGKIWTDDRPITVDEEPVATNVVAEMVTAPPTEAVVEKMVAAMALVTNNGAASMRMVTNNEPVEIEFSVRPRLASGETNAK